MSITITTTVFCDECGDWEENATVSSYAPRAIKARQQTRRLGWKVIRRDNTMHDICPKCVKALGIKKDETP